MVTGQIFWKENITLQDMEDMKNCYDTLLSAAAATANSAYEFSESLRDMGTCLLQKNALNDDEDSGKVLLMLGKLQFELQKLADSYRSHVTQTIINPSDSLLNELRTVEEMKRQCDEKRNVYEDMIAALRDKGRPRNSKEHISSQKLQQAQEDFDEEATLFIFRLKSLKQGQSRSLLTQAARHHAAQLNFFKKGLMSLEAVEPHVKLITEKHHIDYQFSGLEYDTDGGDDDAESYDANYDGELSFDYGQNDHGQQVVSTSGMSMELDQVDFPRTSSAETVKGLFDEEQGDFAMLSRTYGAGSQSAPIFSNNKSVPEDTPSSTKKFHTYTLPTPAESKTSVSSGCSSNLCSGMNQPNLSHAAQSLWHSSPLEPKKTEKDDQYYQEEAWSVLRENNINSVPFKVPPSHFEGILARSELQFASDPKKIKRNAFSGPIMSKASGGKTFWSSGGPTEHPAGHPPSASLKVSSASSPLMSSPKITEVHELPRPPVSLRRFSTPTSLMTHSAPLGTHSWELSSRTPLVIHTPSPLPIPPGSVPRSFSIPSGNSQRGMPVPVSEVDSPIAPFSFRQSIEPPAAAELSAL